ncbi:MAG: SDR family oxidoreductase [Alphaproteobacteria bacterium]|nr:SDR family oxidoreductase [Alphaproteobacteria bacterium]
MAKGHADKIAVITGGATGIGQAFARRLAEDGARIVIADFAPADETLALVAARGRPARAVVTDVSTPEGVDALAAAVAREFGGCDILINNVGIFPNRPFDEVSFADWKRVMAVNLDSMFLTAKAFVPGMKARGWGRIVNMASNTVATAVTGYTHYIASKGGVIGFTRALASDLGPSGITVNAIAPSLTRTTGTTTTNPRAPERFDHVASFQVIKRTQTVDDLVGAMSFLTSDDAAFITGQTLYVDGGWVRR